MMDSEELRPIVLHVLKTYPTTSSLSITSAIDAVQSFGVNKGIYPKKTGQFRGGTSSEILMPLEDREKVRQILWELIIAGVLVPGHDELNPNLPNLSITDYGKKCLEEEMMIPHDPDGYLKDLKKQAPSLDPIAEMYVSEALQAYL